ncbi:unnamed protein product [Caenorhabditis bovis]|uniref:ILEI/PANDER domain-containing protein n=1 Tax=Caenorhabditis bovis TaxID=2654633 RepID=A0A8S1F5L6_9PELO|nr:unnamed protein product [Caenorhabditis bovis]
MGDSDPSFPASRSNSKSASSDSDEEDFSDDEEQYSSTQNTNVDLRLKKCPPFCGNKFESDEEYRKPLGVVYDEVRKHWLICCQSDKVIQIKKRRGKSEVNCLSHDKIRNPSAIAIYQEGKSAAILCSEHTNRNFYIVLLKYGTKNSKIDIFATWKHDEYQLFFQCRGIAKSIAGNLITIDMPIQPRSPRIRIFQKYFPKQINFDIEGARRPSFISSCDDKLAISDLGTQKVFLYKISDIDFSNPNISLLNLIDSNYISVPRTAKSLANEQGFLFVAGVQFDRDGHLLVGDASGHTVKLYDPSLRFLHRISSDFPIPYMSSFFFNKRGHGIIIDLRGDNKFVYAQMSGTSKMKPWIETESRPNRPSRSRFNNRVTKCYYSADCPDPQLLFRMQTETDSAPPFACVNDIKVLHNLNIERGMNVAALNGTTGETLSTQVFDVTASDEKLMQWMADLPHKSILMAASFGDVAEHVSRQARGFFKAFGARKIDSWRGGQAYAIVGQRGIQPGDGFETMYEFNSGTTEMTMIENCIDLPFAKTRRIELKVDQSEVHRADESRLENLGAFHDDLVKKKNQVVQEKYWKDCGLKKPCDEDSIAVHFYSGEHKEDSPKMCIGDKLLFDEELNDAGRGLNLAMMEPKTGRVTAVVHFDTYRDESHGLEEWLDAVPTGYIVAVISFDEASNMLTDMARRIFYEMGSSMIDRMKFRASWYFIGQKGIGAYTPFEDLNIPSGNNWATPIKTSFCLPKALSKWSGRKDPASANDVRNLPKRHFCAKYDRHEEFCNDEKLDDRIVPRILRNENRANDPIFNVPILVAAGLAPDSLRSTLQTLMNQEGINTQLVIVAYDKEYPENADLSSLFHVKSFLLSSLANAFSVFPEAKELIVIEEDVKLSDDWLEYFSAIYQSFTNDKTVDFALAYNPNGFIETSGPASTVYRINGQNLIGSYIIKRELFEQYIRLREFCCFERSNWDLRDSTVFVPALSRIELQEDGGILDDSVKQQRLSSK